MPARLKMERDAAESRPAGAKISTRWSLLS
jgi:hypothetical protein